MSNTVERVTRCTWASNVSYDPDHYRVVFFSCAPIGEPFLEELVRDDRYDVVWVVTFPDAKSWRGMKLRANSVKSKAIELMGELLPPAPSKIEGEHKDWLQWFNTSNIIVTPKKINPDKSEEWKQFAEWLTEKKPDFIIVVAYGKIIPQSILDVPRIAPINIHGSLLPKYRGASPIQDVFLHGETETWITLMRMEAWLDTWPMIEKLSFDVSFDRTARNVIEAMKEYWPTFVTKTLPRYVRGELVDKVQDDEKATFCTKIEKEDGLVDPFADSLEQIYGKYRAYILRPKVFFMYDLADEKQLRVVVETLVLDEKLFDNQKNQPLFIDRQWTLHNAVQEIRVKPEWKKAMSRHDFLRGYG